MYPGAARTPTCRMPPPSAFLIRRARRMKASGPMSSEPAGAPRPLLKHTLTLSTGAQRVPTSTPRLVAALKIRAPSR
eukprot:scaffold97_cov261-Pinguiococcus_pyrenoidosus.AAC.35